MVLASKGRLIKITVVVQTLLTDRSKSPYFEDVTAVHNDDGNRDHYLTNLCNRRIPTGDLSFGRFNIDPSNQKFKEDILKISLKSTTRRKPKKLLNSMEALTELYNENRELFNKKLDER